MRVMRVWRGRWSQPSPSSTAVCWGGGANWKEEITMLWSQERVFFFNPGESHTYIHVMHFDQIHPYFLPSTPPLPSLLLLSSFMCSSKTHRVLLVLPVMEHGQPLRDHIPTPEENWLLFHQHPSIPHSSSKRGGIFWASTGRRIFRKVPTQ